MYPFGYAQQNDWFYDDFTKTNFRSQWENSKMFNSQDNSPRIASVEPLTMNLNCPMWTKFSYLNRIIIEHPRKSTSECIFHPNQCR